MHIKCKLFKVVRMLCSAPDEIFLGRSVAHNINKERGFGVLGRVGVGMGARSKCMLGGGTENNGST